jgi:hypothetical protein
MRSRIGGVGFGFDYTSATVSGYEHRADQVARYRDGIAREEVRSQVKHRCVRVQLFESNADGGFY